MFITCRRAHIDSFLKKSIPLMKGKVLDIGGKKKNKRGDFTPPKTESWKYLNLDESTSPDLVCDAGEIPLDDQSCDTILMCELLEHVYEPEKVVKEGYRLLKNEGILIITIPFLIPFHSDPCDYQRFTYQKLSQMLENYNFCKIEIFQHGSILSVIFDLFYAALCRSKNRGSFFNRIGFLFQNKLGPFAIRIDKRFNHLSDYINTGYGIVAYKK